MIVFLFLELQFLTAYSWSKYAVRINGWRFAGAIEPEGVTRAICAAYVRPLKECEALTSTKTVLQKTYIRFFMAVL